MKIKKDFILRKMNEMNLVVAVGNAVKEFNGYISLNETGCFLWEKLSTGASEKDLIDALLAEYDVSEEIATKDVKTFIDTLDKNNLLEK